MGHIVRPVAREGQADHAVEQIDGRLAQIDVLVRRAQCAEALEDTAHLGAWDDRIGVAAVIDTLQKVGKTHPNTLYGVGTVQEEVGLRGARTSSNMIEPDVAFAIDVTIATDTPGCDGAGADLGSGVGIMVGNVLARTVGVIAAALSCVINFAWLPYQPVWGSIMIAVSVAVIWALTVHGRDITAA